MKYSRKAINIVNDTWEYLENNYKGSEITMSLLIYTIERKCVYFSSVPIFSIKQLAKSTPWLRSSFKSKYSN